MAVNFFRAGVPAKEVALGALRRTGWQHSSQPVQNCQCQATAAPISSQCAASVCRVAGCAVKNMRMQPAHTAHWLPSRLNLFPALQACSDPRCRPARLAPC